MWADDTLSEEEVLLAASTPTEEAAAGPLQIALVISVKSGMNSLGRIIKTIEVRATRTEQSNLPV